MTWLTGPENDYSPLLGLPDPEPTRTVAVVIPVYNRVDLLARTVAGLAAQTYPASLLTVVVADDGSDEDVALALAPFSQSPSLTVVRQEHDGYGAGRARNLGAAAADADVLVFIDADCVPDRELVSRHARWHHLVDNAVVIGSRHGVDTSSIAPADLAAGAADLHLLAFGRSDPDEADFRPGDNRAVLHRRTAGQRTGNEAFRSLVSSNFSLLADRFADAGGFSPDFRRWGGEDIELGWRLWNDGMFFIPDDRAACYHQLQEDHLGGEGRKASKDLNAGILSSKIPHRFYRREVHGPIYEVPKVTWVIAPSDDRTDEEMFDRLIRHRYLDSEVIFAGPGPHTSLLAEAYAGDPRFGVAHPGAGDPSGVGAAVRAARGEYIALLHGGAAVDRRLLTRTLRTVEANPRVARVSVGYRVGTGPARHNHRNPGDVARLDAAWGVDRLPVFALSTRREWIKALRAAGGTAAAWRLLTEQTRGEHLPDELVTLPSPTPRSAPLPPQEDAVSDRSRLAFDLQGPATVGSVVSAFARFAVARARRRPHREPPDRAVGGDLAAGGDDAGPAAAPAPAPRIRPRIRYVGWSGHENLGDDAMLEAVRRLFDWGDVQTSRRGEVMLLGGGTLINRARYLEWLNRQDSPRIERAVFGTGVANPSYWGQREPAAEWVKFLDSCGYVGVRGPVSLQTLRDWGFSGEAEVVGDPALALTVPPDGADPVPGRVVLAPAWTAGELWGKDDRPVLAAMAGLAEQLTMHGREVVMLSCHPGDDRHVFEMMRAAGRPDMAYLAGYDDLTGALRLLASADLVVAERLHGAVLAAAAGTPFVAIEYRPKVADFAASVDMGHAVLRADAVTTSALSGLVADVETDAEASLRLTAAVARYRSRLEAAAAVIAALVRRP